MRGPGSSSTSRARAWPRRTLAGAVAIGLLVGSVWGTSLTGNAGGTVPAPARIGPLRVVDSSDVADPFILPFRTGGHGAQPTTTYYRFGTTDWQSNVPTAQSTDLIHWQPVPDALPELPRWATPSVAMTWAPAVVATHGHYVLYVTTEEASSGRQCIAMATSATPAGPYVDTSDHPFQCQRDLGGSIDPTVARDSSGRLRLAWKNDGNCCGLPTSLWEQALTSDGLHLTGAVHRLLSADEAWQQGNIEAPALAAAPGHGWWLFYSGGSWRTPDYATGLAYCPTIQGPCHEVSDRPWLASTPELRTPGGLETFVGPGGRLWVALTSTVPIESRRHPGRFFQNRVLSVAPVLGS